MFFRGRARGGGGRCLLGRHDGRATALGEVSHQFQTLAFATGKSIERLAQSQVFEADLGQQLKLVDSRGALALQENDGFRHCEVEDIVDRFSIEQVRASDRREARAVAGRTLNEEIREELHFHLFVPGPLAPTASS